MPWASTGRGYPYTSCLSPPFCLLSYRPQRSRIWAHACHVLTHLLSSSYLDLEKQTGRDERASWEGVPLLSPQWGAPSSEPFLPPVSPRCQRAQLPLQNPFPSLPQ